MATVQFSKSRTTSRTFRQLFLAIPSSSSLVQSFTPRKVHFSWFHFMSHARGHAQMFTISTSSFLRHSICINFRVPYWANRLNTIHGWGHRVSEPCLPPPPFRCLRLPRLSASREPRFDHRATDPF
ncbi:hypothetical protein BU23DRAFT_49067 [Bimuria novae-zelandiae CBS 107.79]|uniref:Uncharacterized protein n=1 Tax=Bimuria novae-zelandiae CBS 107.79 TaxID=1447943 RepID=A0A6A5UJ25_9PLEO|nr:hypothetical protein BU23DRAFT_49067 [Bimuria novae-zelandiae CBS 107.79]